MGYPHADVAYVLFGALTNYHVNIAGRHALARSNLTPNPETQTQSL